MLLHTLPPEPLAIVGRATVIDGDTLEIHGQRIRLWGVDAPESRQTCERGGEVYRCGQEAANALSAWIGQRTVVCTPEGRPDRYRRVVAKCEVRLGPSAPDETAADPLNVWDINDWMILNGWALDYPRYSEGAYAQLERLASANYSGIWVGTFQRPWEWRAR